MCNSERDGVFVHLSACRRVLRYLLALLILMSGKVVAAEDPDPVADPTHFDVIVSSLPAAGGLRIAADVAGVFPRDYATQRVLVPADFGDFAGGPYKTDDPGWVVPAGQLLPGEVLRYRALGRLWFWNNNRARWEASVPRGESVRLFGEVPAEVVLRNDPAELALYRQGTIWTVNGVEGPREAAIEAADAAGTIHSHLDFCVQDSAGDCSRPGLGHSGAPTAGAYMIELQLLVAAAANGQRQYRASNPLMIVLNRGLSGADFQRAVQARTIAAPPQEAQPLPAAGILIIAQEGRGSRHAQR